MTSIEALSTFDACGARLVDSHFVYTSGRHGHTYMNKDALYLRPRTVKRICVGLAAMFRADEVQIVVGPATGGIGLAHGVAAALSSDGEECLSAFAEKDSSGQFRLRRGFAPYVGGRQVLVVEDVLTTGGSAAAVVAAVREAGGNVVGVAAILNRGRVTGERVGVTNMRALAELDLPDWEPDLCPLCAAGVPIDTRVGKSAV